MGPGQIQLTVIPSFPSLVANDLVKPITPCLAAVYGLAPGVAPKPSVEEMLTILGDSDSLCVNLSYSLSFQPDL